MTGIEWTDRTWNPVRGCTRVSPGCVNCYAERLAARFSGPGRPYEGLAKSTKAAQFLAQEYGCIYLGERSAAGQMGLFQ